MRRIPSKDLFGCLQAVILGLFLIASGCSRNTIPTATYSNVKEKDILIIMDTTALKFDVLKGRFKIKADLNGDVRTFNADVRWDYNDTIWMSFSIFGIEGVRALFTRDSVKVINKLADEYYYGDYASLARLSQVELSFNEIEAMLLGRLFGVEDKKPDIRYRDNRIFMEMKSSEYEALVELDRNTVSIQHYWINSVSAPRRLEVILDEYEFVNGKPWPAYRNYSIVSGDTYLKVEATSQKLELNEKLEYPFYVNPKYKRIPL